MLRKQEKNRIPVIVGLIGIALIMVILPVLSGNADPGGAPYYIYGYVYDIDGVTPLDNNSVTITNVTGGQYIVTSTDSNGYYQYDVGSIWNSATNDPIRVNATDGTYNGENTTTVNTLYLGSWCNVTLIPNNPPNAPNLTAPANNTWANDNTPLFDWDFSDPDGDASGGYNISIDDDVNFGSINYYVNWSTSNNQTHWQFPGNTSYSNISDGTWYWRVKANDTSGAWSDWSRYYIINIDMVAPVISIEYNNSKTYCKDSDMVRIYANFTEADSGIDESSVKISIDYAGGTDLSPTLMSKTNNTHWYYDLDIPSGSIYDGQFTVNVTAKDNATNALSPDPTQDSSKYIDNTAPTVAIEYNNSKTYYRDADMVRIYANFTETGSGINESSVKISIDTSGTDVTNQAMSKTDNTHWYYDWNVPSGSEGNVNVSVSAQDNASNPLGGTTWDKSKYVDNTAPAVTVVAPSNGTTGVPVDTTIAVTFNESMDNTSVESAFNVYQDGNGTPVAGSYSWSGNQCIFTPSSVLLGNTKHWANVSTVAKDLAGNPLSAGNSTYFTTGAGATATASGPTGYSTVTGVTLAYSWTGSPDSVKIYYTNNGNASWTLAGEDGSVDGSYGYTIISDDGTYGWIAVAVGGGSTEADPPAGGTSAEKYGLVLDTTSPTVSSTTPTDGSTTSDVWENVLFTFSESMNITTVSYTVQNSTTWSNTFDAEWNADKTILWLSHTTAFNDLTTYWINITAGKDLAGNDVTGSLRYLDFYVDVTAGDTTPPNSYVNTLPWYWNNTGTASITATATDANDVECVGLWYSYSSNNVSWGGMTLLSLKTTAPWTWTFSFPNGAGWYNLSTNSTDNSSNHNKESVNPAGDVRIGYDNTQPSNPAPLAIETHGAENNTWQNFVASPTFKWNYPNDNLSGVDGFYWYFGTSGTGTGTNYTNMNETTAGTVGNGTYYFRVMSRDKAGNNNGSWVTMFVFKYDATLPVSTIAAPAEASCFKYKPIWFNGTCSDNLSGIKSVEINITYKDNNTLVQAWTNVNLSSNYTWWNYPFSPTEEANYTIRIRAVDNASNYQVSISINITYDITPPTTNITLMGTLGTNGWYVSNVTINLTATDILCGVLRIENSTNYASFGTYMGNFTLTTDGTYYIQYRAVDKAGNVETTQLQIVKIDKTKPGKPQLVAPGNDTWTNTSSVLFDWQNSSDTCSGVANYTLQVSKTQDFSYLNYTAVNLTATVNTSLPLDDGIYYWRVIVKDNASNSNTSDVWVVKIDTGKPGTPVLITPINNEVTPDNTPTFKWSPVADTFSELAYYTIQVSTTPYFLPSDIVYEANPAVNYSTPINTIDDGPYCWRVRAVDNANNVGEWATTTFWVDSGAPKGLMLQINNDANYTNSANITLTISVDNPSVDYCICFSNDGVSWSDNESYSTTKTWDLTNTAYGGNATEGKKTVYVRCKKYEGADVFAQSDSSIILDLTPPGVALQSPQNDTWTNSSCVEFRWKAWDNFKLSGKYHIQIMYKNNYTLLHEMYLNNGTVNNDTSIYEYSLPDGMYLWRVRAEDKAFNWSGFTDYRVVKTDTQPPAGPMLYQPGNNVTVAEMNVTLGWQNLSLYDFSGIHQYEMWINTNIFYIPPQNNSTTITLPDGTYYWKIRAVDIAGNIGSFSETWLFIIDRKGPKDITFLVNGDATYTNIEQVYLSIHAKNTAWMRFSNDSENWTEWETYTIMREWELLWVENSVVNRTVYLECKSWNNVKSPVISDSITLDKTPPFACIIDEPQIINRTYFVLSWYSEYAVQGYDISTDGINWIDVGQNTTWNFTLLKENYNILYVRAVAADGSPGGADSLQILVDTKKPVGVSLEINSNAGFTNSSTVQLRLEAEEDLSEDFASGLWKIYLWDGGEQVVEINTSEIFDPLVVTMEWVLLGADGSKTVWFKVVDRAGNEAVVCGTIFLDRVMPANLSIGMPDYMNSTAIPLTLFADDPGMGSGLWQMCFSEDGVVWDDWTAYSTGFVYELKDVSDDLKTIYFRVRDRAGNENTVNVGVVLDRTKPVINIIQTPSNLTEDYFYLNITVTITEVNPHGLPLLTYRIGNESVVSENMLRVNGNTFYFNISIRWDDYKGMCINYTVSYSDMAGNTNITVMCELVDNVVDEDLWVSAFSWEPDKVTVDGLVNITVVIHNNNESDLSNVEVVFYWRYYGLPGGCIGRVFVNLSAGSSVNVTISYSFPLAVEGYLDVKIDPDNRISEIDKSNNVFTKPFIVWELPDLMLVDVSFTPVLPVENETVQIIVEIGNIGGDFSKNFTVGFWVGGFVNNTFNGSLIGTATCDPVSSLKTSVISYSWKAVPGEWIIYVEINSTGIIEKSLGNNNFSANLTVLTIGINVIVDWVDTTKSVEPGGVLDYSLKIKNMGNVNETFNLSVDAPSGWKTIFLFDGEKIVNIPLGKGEEKRIVLRIYVPDNADEGEVRIRVIAVSQNMSTISYTKEVVVKVKPKDVFQWWVVAVVAAILIAVIGLLMKTGVLVVKAKPEKVKIEHGYNYLIKGSDVRKPYSVFIQLMKKTPGLCITSTHPRKRRDKFQLKCPVYWLTDITRTDEETLHPERLDFELFKTVNDFVKAKHGVVMLDGLEYLIGVNGFERTMEFIDTIRDIVSTHNGTLIVPTNPSVFKEEELGMLEKKFDRILG